MPMEYRGKFPFFPYDKITTYPIANRKNKVTQESLYWPDKVMDMKPEFSHPDLGTIADAILDAREKGYPVIWLMGAHPIKAGMSPLIIDLMQRGICTLLCGNFASAIHDFELALIGETSEVVPNALPAGEFGLAAETGFYINDALAWGNERSLGLGETLGRVINGEAKDDLDMEFPFKHESYLAQGSPSTRRWAPTSPISIPTSTASRRAAAPDATSASSRRTAWRRTRRAAAST